MNAIHVRNWQKVSKDFYLVCDAWGRPISGLQWAGKGGEGRATRLSFLLPLRKDKGSLRGLTRSFSIEATIGNNCKGASFLYCNVIPYEIVTSANHVQQPTHTQASEEQTAAVATKGRNLTASIQCRNFPRAIKKIFSCIIKWGKEGE